MDLHLTVIVPRSPFPEYTHTHIGHHFALGKTHTYLLVIYSIFFHLSYISLHNSHLAFSLPHFSIDSTNSHFVHITVLPI